MPGLLPVIIYNFKEPKKTTTILFNEGSTVSLIQKSLANSLFLEGFPLMTSLYRACEQDVQPALCTHYDVLMRDRSGKDHIIRVIEVDHICDP